MNNYVIKICVLGAASVAIASRANAQLVGLGDLPGGAFDSQALGISADGTTVVGYSSSGLGIQAFRWRAGPGITALAGDVISLAFNCSPNGSIICGSTSGGSAMPTIWTDDANGTPVPVAIGRILPGGGNGVAWDISDNGLIAVGYSNSNESTYNALQWTSPGPVASLPDFLGGSSARVARAVSGNGNVIAGIGSIGFTTTGDVACRWVTPFLVAESLNYLPGGALYGDSFGISSDGTVIVGSSASNATATNREAFTWKSFADGGSGAMVSLGDLPGGAIGSQANSISDDKQVIVGWGTTAAGRRAFVWDPCHGMRDLKAVLEDAGFGASVAGWTLSEAWGVSADGSKIAGFGINPSGQTEAWIVTMPCEPITQPISQSLCDNRPVAFSVAGDCPSAATYQWRWNGLFISDQANHVLGATTATLVLINTTSSDIGLYDCIVTNACGTVSSGPALLSCTSMLTQPGSHPESQTVCCNNPAVFSVHPDCCAESATYQWLAGDGTIYAFLVDGDDGCGNIVSGATSQRLQITPGNSNWPGCGAYFNGQHYACIVTNACGSIRSNDAILTIPCPADFNCDGSVDFFDYLDFVDAFSIGC